MNAKKKVTPSGQNKRSINVLVRATAGIVALLLVCYFVLTLNNMSSITQRVEERKDGAYPTSIAAGHIETGLSKVLSMMDTILALDDTTDPVDFKMLESVNQENNREIKSQISILTSDRFSDEENIHELVLTYEEITEELASIFSKWEGDHSSLPYVKAQISDSLIPKIEHAIAVDNAIIDSTERDIEDLYNTVLEAIQQTILFSLVLIMGIFVAIFIYISLLSRKEEYEQELSNHLKDALALAQNANAAKSAFLSNMSHDMRTPLNAIIGLSAIAEDNLADPVKMKQCLTQINTSSHHLLQLINDVLDVNRIESGKTILSEETFSLPDLVAELSAINEPQALEKKLDCEFILKEIQHEYVIGDPIRIRQIMLNLTSNAIKYTNPGDSIAVTFEEYRASREGFANIRITVSDTGVGMSQDFMQQIFEPFERERNERTKFIEGTGLGMAITKNLVTMMGGQISVESELGRGTTFTVELALRIPDQIPKLDTSILEGVKVLAISNDALLLDTTISMLDEFGMDASKTVAIQGKADAFCKELLKRASGFEVIFAELLHLGKEESEIWSRTLDSIASDNHMLVIRSDESLQMSVHKENDLGITAYIKQPVFRSRLYETLRENLEMLHEEMALSSLSETAGEAASLSGASSAAGSGSSSGEGASGDGARDGIVEDAKDGLGSERAEASRILIVEDNELNMEIATELVLKYGVQVDQAYNGVEAVDMVKDKPEGYYDLIFMDWQMPVMDGIDATKAIISYFDDMGYAHTPIVAMTANAFVDNRREAMAAGMDGFMAKPINIKELKDYLRKYCHLL